MAYLPSLSTTSTIDAVLTRQGKQKLVSSTENFDITKFGFADDEINYNLIDETQDSDHNDVNIQNLAIPEPSTNSFSEMLSKIYVHQPFANTQFNSSATGNNVGKFMDIVSSIGNNPALHSDNTTRKIYFTVSLIDQLNRPSVPDFLDIKFSDQVDCYTVSFINPPLTDQVNNNFTKLSNTEYLFTAQNFDGTPRYRINPTGQPCIVFAISFNQTTAFFDLIKLPQNKDRIIVSNFVTVKAVDSSRSVISDIKSASMDLQIINIA